MYTLRVDQAQFPCVAQTLTLASHVVSVSLPTVMTTGREGLESFFFSLGKETVPKCNLLLTRLCVTTAPELDTTGQCRWQYGESGMNLVCSTAGEVLSGRCGVGFNTDCPNTSAHGIYCCSYN